MQFNTSSLIARLLWLAPALLLFLTVNQIKVALDLRYTLENGIAATAEIMDFESTDRVEISYDYVSLRVRLADGRVIEHERMSLPHSFVPLIEGKKTVDVRVLPGAAQEIIIASVGRAHWRLAAINAVMCFVGFVLLAVGVFAWNRFLRRKGDPAQRNVLEEPAAPQTATLS